MLDLIINNITPLLITLLGFINLLRPASKDGILGYRTSRSLRSEETWKFANLQIGLLWSIIGLSLIIISSLISIFLRDNSNYPLFVFLLSILQILTIPLSLYRVEKQLMTKFDSKGNRKKIRLDKEE